LSLDPSWLLFLLRSIDGYPAIIGTPIRFLFANELGSHIGIPPRNIRIFTGTIGIYGLASLIGIRNGEVPLWLAATGLTVNAVAFVAAGRSLFLNSLPPVGRLCHIAFLIPNALVTYGLAASASTYFSSAKPHGFS
jgi:hypothetical protein